MFKKHKKLLTQFSIFALGGGVNFVLNTGLTYFLTDIVGMYYLLSYAIVQVIIIIYGFLYNTFLTFKLKKASRTVFIKFVILLHVFALVNIGIVKLLTDYFGINYLFSIIITIIVTLFFRFYIYKKYVFTEKIDDSQKE